jgi:RsiW-degrading membrane proteinase PrsW (M82 family)
MLFFWAGSSAWNIPKTAARFCISKAPMAALEMSERNLIRLSAHKRMPLAVALAAQAIGGIVVFGAAFVLLRISIFQPPLIILLSLHGLVAAVAGHRFGLAK